MPAPDKATLASVPAYKKTPNVSRDPEKLQQIRKWREAGETLSAIGRYLDISRERVRQICEKNGIPTVSEMRDDKAQQAIDLLKTGLTRAEASEKAGISPGTLRRYADKHQIDLEEIVREARKHRFDGRTFGWWTVLDGTYHYDPDHPNQRTVECVCKCGVQKTVQINNLLNCVSRGCGCRNKNGRKRTPWVCVETGEQMSSSFALAKHLEVNPILLYRRLNKGKSFTKDGQTWKPLEEEAVGHHGRPAAA